MYFFDPDRNWRSADKVQHALGCFVVAGALNLTWFLLWDAALATLLVGVAFELGQADGVRGSDRSGVAGYGFGLLDLAADAVGILAWIVLASILR